MEWKPLILSPPEPTVGVWPLCLVSVSSVDQFNLSKPKNDFYFTFNASSKFFVSSKYDFIGTIFESWGDDEMIIAFSYSFLNMFRIFWTKGNVGFWSQLFGLCWQKSVDCNNRVPCKGSLESFDFYLLVSRNMPGAQERA